MKNVISIRSIASIAFFVSGPKVPTNNVIDIGKKSIIHTSVFLKMFSEIDILQNAEHFNTCFCFLFFKNKIFRSNKKSKEK